MSLDVYLKCNSCGCEHYSANITHNLNTMAKIVGIYTELWRPETVYITHARQLIRPLKLAIRAMKGNKDKLLKYNPNNGWGTYEGLLIFMKDYLIACCRYPKDKVIAWR